MAEPREPAKDDLAALLGRHSEITERLKNAAPAEIQRLEASFNHVLNVRRPWQRRLIHAGGQIGLFFMGVAAAVAYPMLTGDLEQDPVSRTELVVVLVIGIPSCVVFVASLITG